jgi:hypothetical protein
MILLPNRRQLSHSPAWSGLMLGWRVEKTVIEYKVLNKVTFRDARNIIAPRQPKNRTFASVLTTQGPALLPTLQQQLPGTQQNNQPSPSSLHPTASAIPRRSLQPPHRGGRVNHPAPRRDNIFNFRGAPNWSSSSSAGDGPPSASNPAAAKPPAQPGKPTRPPDKGKPDNPTKQPPKPNRNNSDRIPKRSDNPISTHNRFGSLDEDPGSMDMEDLDSASPVRAHSESNRNN